MRPRPRRRAPQRHRVRQRWWRHPVRSRSGREGSPIHHAILVRRLEVFAPTLAHFLDQLRQAVADFAGRGKVCSMPLCQRRQGRLPLQSAQKCKTRYATLGAAPPLRAGRRWAACRPLGEAAGERAQRRTADRGAELGDAEVATPAQRHCVFDATPHQVRVRRLAFRWPRNRQAEQILAPLRAECPADMFTQRLGVRERP